MRKLYIEAALLLVAISVSAYLLLFEQGSTLYCPNPIGNALIDCGKVLSSGYAHIFGVPLAMLSLIWSVLALILLLFDRGRHFKLSGMVAVLYSSYAMYRIGNICVYCLCLDAILTALFITALMDIRKRRSGIGNGHNRLESPKLLE